MSAQSLLIDAVGAWERRRKWGVILENLPYALLPGLSLGAGLALYSRFRPGPSDTLSLTVALGGALLGVAILFGAVWLRRRSPVESARWFDHRFGLQERVSTALELIEGRIRADETLADMQLADAEKTAAQVQPAALLPFSTDGRMWILNLALLTLLAFLLMATSPVVALDSDRDRERAAIEAAAADVTEIIQDIAADPTLSDEQRGPLLEALQTQLETLRDPNLSLEEALATLGEVESVLSDSADAVQQELLTQQQAEAQANAAMESLTPNAQAQPLDQNIEAIQGDLENMSPEQIEAAAAALDNAAEAMEQANPEMSEALREAAAALREGDTEAAGDALERAAQEARQAQAERGQQADAERQMRQNAEQAGEAQQQAAQQGQEGQQGSESSEMQGSQGEQAGSQQGQGMLGPEASEGLTPGEGGNSPSAPSDSATQGDSEQPGQVGRGGDGMGDGAGGMDQDASAAGRQPGDDGGEDTPNNPDGAGESRYQPVFAPRFAVEAAGEDDVRLGADPGDAPLTQGDFQDNPTGESVVPYNQVFSSYADAASRALDADYIPLGMRDVIRDYFSSLDPQQ